MRLMNGKPLIAYAIENALASRYVDKVLVSSDSEEVLAFASQYDNVLALGRESRLAQDAVTLDPVVYDAISRCEADGLFDVVVTLQPTSPLLSVETLDAALEYFLSSELDTLISVVNNPHLAGWRIARAAFFRRTRNVSTANSFRAIMSKRELSSSRVGSA